jgi:hypothetical protein
MSQQMIAAHGSTTLQLVVTAASRAHALQQINLSGHGEVQ